MIGFFRIPAGTQYAERLVVQFRSDVLALVIVSMKGTFTKGYVLKSKICFIVFFVCVLFGQSLQVI